MPDFIFIAPIVFWGGKPPKIGCSHWLEGWPLQQLELYRALLWCHAVTWFCRLVVGINWWVFQDSWDGQTDRPDSDPSTMNDVSWLTAAWWSPLPLTVTLLASTGSAIGTATAAGGWNCCTDCICCCICCCCCSCVNICCCCCCCVTIDEVLVALLTVSITIRDSARIDPGTPAPKQITVITHSTPISHSA